MPLLSYFLAEFEPVYDFKYRFFYARSLVFYTAISFQFYKFDTFLKCFLVCYFRETVVSESRLREHYVRKSLSELILNIT